MSHLEPVELTADQVKKLNVIFTPQCSVNIYDDNQPQFCIGHGSVSRVMLQYLPKVELFYEVEMQNKNDSHRSRTNDSAGSGMIKKKRVKLENLRFRNGCPIYVTEQEVQMKGIILGNCDIPSNFVGATPPNSHTGTGDDAKFWYSVQLLRQSHDGEGTIMHAIQPSKISYRSTISIKEEDAARENRIVETTAVSHDVTVKDEHLLCEKSANAEIVNSRRFPVPDTVSFTSIANDIAFPSSEHSRAQNDLEEFPRSSCKSLDRADETNENEVCEVKFATPTRKIGRSLDVASNKNDERFLPLNQEPSPIVSPEIKNRWGPSTDCRENNLKRKRIPILDQDRTSDNEKYSNQDHPEKVTEMVRDSNFRNGESPEVRSTPQRSRRSKHEEIGDTKDSTIVAGGYKPFDRSIMHQPPDPSESKTKMMQGRLHHWCGKCRGGRGYWTKHKECDHIENHPSTKRRLSSCTATSTGTATSLDHARRPGRKDIIRNGTERERRSASSDARYDNISDKSSQRSSSVMKSERITNKHYQASMFRRILNKKKSLIFLRGQGDTPSSFWEKNTPMCVYYHVRGFCVSHCPRAVDHTDPPMEKLESLLEWCDEKCSDEEFTVPVPARVPERDTMTDKEMAICKLRLPLEIYKAALHGGKRYQC